MVRKGHFQWPNVALFDETEAREVGLIPVDTRR